MVSYLRHLKIIIIPQLEGMQTFPKPSKEEVSSQNRSSPTQPPMELQVPLILGFSGSSWSRDTGYVPVGEQGGTMQGTEGKQRWGVLGAKECRRIVTARSHRM